MIPAEYQIEAFIRRIYAILMEECDAPAHWESDFVHHFMSDHPPREYRFCGRLGFGGKFWWGPLSVPHVNCYPEDENVKRLELISRTNERLQQLFNEFPK